MKKIFLTLALFIGLVNVCLAMDPAVLDKTFNEANSLYKGSRYAEAASLYESILSSGSENGTLYYNLGNCYFKSGSLGKAVLNYERARLFMPRDPDLKANRAYALSLLQPGGPDAGNPLLRFIDNVSSMVTLDSLCALASFCYFSVFLLLAIMLADKRRVRIYSIAAVCLSMIFLVSSSVLMKRYSVLKKTAVVISADRKARFEPFDNSTVHFSISEGSMLQVLEIKPGWCKVRRADSKTGWVEKDSIEMLYRRLL